MTAAVAGTDFVAPNSAITSATKTKITYDTKGLVTAGADATTADIAPSTDRNYVTDIKAGVLSNTSGVNTGDQTITLTGDVTGTGTGTFTSTIANSAVTYAKMQNVTAGKLLGSISASDAAPGAVAIGSGLTLSGGTLTASGTGGTVTNVNPITVNASGSTFTSTVTNASTTPAISLTIPLASVAGTTAGLLSNTDYAIFNAKVAPNSAITGATKTKITYDTKGLVTAGADATTADIAPSTDRNYVTDIKAGVLSNTSGVNTGDQTITLTGDVTGTGTGTFTSTIANSAVTYAKIQNIAPTKLLGSISASSAAPGAVTIGMGLSLADGTLTATGTGGTVTSVSPIIVTASGSTFTSTVTNATSTPAIALTIPLASETGTTAGLLSNNDYAAFNAKQSALTLGAGVQTFLATPTSANLANTISDETGSGSLVFATSPTLETPVLGNATATSLSSGTLSLTTALTATNGGTGQSTYATGDILYASATNTLSKLGIGATGTVLTVNSGIPSWGSNGLYSLNGITSGTHSLTTGTSGTDFNISSSGSTHTFNLPDASATARGAVTTGIQTFAGNKTFSGTLSTTSLTATSGLTAGAVTYPIAHGSSGQVLSTTGSGTLTWTTPSAGITGVGTITTTSYAEGAAVSANSLILAPASANFGGVVSTFTQTFAGAKTFDSDIIANTVNIGLGKTSNGTSNATNTAVGSFSLNANTTGQRNAAFGYFSLNANTSGLENTAFGYQTLRANTIGSSNLAFGQNALSSNTEGGANTAMGNAAMESNLTGGSNTAVGSQALNKNKNSYNTAVGQYSMFNNVNGSYNTALGASALQGTTGTYNTGIGYNASVATGDGVTNATAIGNGASASASNTIQLGNASVTSVNTSGALTTGNVTYPIAHGSSGQVLSTTGSGTLTWTTAGAGVTTVSGGTTGLTPNTATSGVVTLAGTLVAANGGTGQSTYATGDILYASAANTLSKLTIGSAGQVLTVSSGIPSWGSNGLYSLNGITSGTHSLTTGLTGTDFNISSSGSTHTFNIPDAGATSTTRGLVSINAQTFYGAKTFNSDLIANGYTIGKGNGNVSSNLAIGSGNFHTTNSTGTANLAIGTNALFNNRTGQFSTSVGHYTLNSSSTGTSNNAFGYYALFGGYGSYNTAIGDSALSSYGTSILNTAVGNSSMKSNTSGSFNTAVGNNSLITNTTGTYNTAIGINANVFANNLTNATAIGANATVSASNTIQLGNTSVTDVKTSGKVTASSFVVIGGTATQALMANGTYGTLPAAHYIGESYGGGIVFYVYDNGQHGLIAATTNQSNGVIWGVSSTIRTFGDGIGAGRNNTAVIASYSNSNSDNAASVCMNYSVTVDNVRYADWYLPSYHELTLLFNQKSLSGLNMSIGEWWYWSSTEMSNIGAWTVKFKDGYPNNQTQKNNSGVLVRAIRHF
jgi:hypothetical protein